MLKIKEFNDAEKLNEFIEKNQNYIKLNYSIEIFKLNSSSAQYCQYSKTNDYVVVPKEIIKYVLKYETKDENEW